MKPNASDVESQQYQSGKHDINIQMPSVNKVSVKVMLKMRATIIENN